MRLSKTINGETTEHVWDGSQQIIADVVNSQYYEANCYLRGTNLVATYNYQNGAKTDYTYYTQNAHGDVVNLTDAQGAVIKSYTYDAFGVEQNIDDSDNNAFRYCGEYYDAESGTIYLRARYYDPTIGRFISRDSYAGKNEDPLSLNLYTYCYNSPIVKIDPSGHVCFGFDILFGNDIVLDPGYSMPIDSPIIDIPSVPTDFVGPVYCPRDYVGQLEVVSEEELEQAKVEEAEKEDDEKQKQTILYHYTNLQGMVSILATQELLPSLKANNPKDARHGDGQYFTDLNPALYTSSQIARRLINIPNQYKYTCYIAIDVTGLEIENPANNIYVHKSQLPLDISGRIVGFGPVAQKKKE